jgi:probable phosphoglycerate mutase
MHFLAQHFRFHEVEKMCCSPLLRCRQSAQFFQDTLGIKPEPVEELAEIDLGGWDGLTVAEVKKRYPGGYEAMGRDMASYRPQDGESFTDLLDRVWSVFTRCGEAGSNTILLTHAGVIRVLLCRIFGMDLADLFTLEIDYGSYYAIRVDNTHYMVTGSGHSPDHLEGDPISPDSCG